VLACEHATDHLPPPWRWPALDLRLLGTHWALDLGAEALTEALAARLAAPAVVAGFSRLLADPNRPEDDPTLFRLHAEGLPVALNERLDASERERRLTVCHRPYHQAFDHMVASSSAKTVFAVHTFTPEYEGAARTVELGILFDEDEALARHVAGMLRDELALRVELNAPYSGREGFMYSPARHARQHGRKALEIELRQDLALQPRIRGQVAAVLARALEG
jgi:predicted N-formylglutamate amidohydrolase